VGNATRNRGLYASLGYDEVSKQYFLQLQCSAQRAHLLPLVIDEIEKTDETFEDDECPIDLPAMQDQFEATRFQGRSLTHKTIRGGGDDEKEKFSPNF
jgi:hypothetical protein